MTYEQVAKEMHRHNADRRTRIMTIMFRAIRKRTGKSQSTANMVALTNMVMRMPEELQGSRMRFEVRQAR